MSPLPPSPPYFFFFNYTATTEIYTLSLHDALPISRERLVERDHGGLAPQRGVRGPDQDRKSTRLNSSHTVISYAVFCLKKKKTTLIELTSDEVYHFGSVPNGCHGPSTNSLVPTVVG